MKSEYSLGTLFFPAYFEKSEALAILNRHPPTPTMVKTSYLLLALKRASVLWVASGSTALLLLFISTEKLKYLKKCLSTALKVRRDKMGDSEQDFSSYLSLVGFQGYSVNKHTHTPHFLPYLDKNNNRPNSWLVTLLFSLNNVSWRLFHVYIKKSFLVLGVFNLG